MEKKSRRFNLQYQIIQVQGKKRFLAPTFVSTLDARVAVVRDGGYRGPRFETRAHHDRAKTPKAPTGVAAFGV